MIWSILLLLAVGVLLSALFSGSETGFYRVTRVRLLLDGLGGDPVSRMLLRLTNHPALFVATALIGNNVANYLTSLGIVLITHQLLADSEVAETLAPLLLSPLVFVYCELLPKQLFFQSPNLLLRRVGPLLLLFVMLFAPIALILWILGWLLERLLGQTPLRVRLALATKELQQVIREGEQAGILHAAQRDLAERLFVHSSESIVRFTTPLSRTVTVPLGTSTRKALATARRQKTSVLAVSSGQGREVVGYVRAIDLILANTQRIEEVRPLPRLPRSQSYLGALVELQTAKADVGLVEDRNGNAVGLVYARRLTETLFQEA
jgi:CBS domain containing-hemolysin-like protein